jgi:hypothetical protein
MYKFLTVQIAGHNTHKLEAKPPSLFAKLPKATSLSSFFLNLTKKKKKNHFYSSRVSRFKDRRLTSSRAFTMSNP